MVKCDKAKQPYNRTYRPFNCAFSHKISSIDLHILVLHESNHRTAVGIKMLSNFLLLFHATEIIFRQNASNF